MANTPSNNPSHVLLDVRVLVKQLNLQKSKIATANFSHKMTEWSRNSLFALLQEPAISKGGKIASLPRGVQVFAARHPRAAILATPGMDVWALPSLTTPDVAVCLWKTGHPDFPTIAMISVYSDQTLKTSISMELQKITDYCASQEVPYVIGSDTNSHSVLWGCRYTDTRGEEYEDFIARLDLCVLNQGSLPTFQTSNRQSIINVSLVHSDLYDLAFGWEVSPSDFLSDHKCLQFEINLTQMPIATVKNWQRTDWPMFASCMIQKGVLWTPPPCGRSPLWTMR